MFNNALVYGNREDPAGKIKFHRMLALNPAIIVELKNGFQITTANKETIILYADPVELKISWLNSFKTITRLHGGSVISLEYKESMGYCSQCSESFGSKKKVKQKKKYFFVLFNFLKVCMQSLWQYYLSSMFS